MNLYAMLKERVAEGRPLAIALIGAGKLGVMCLAQAPLASGLQLFGFADLSVKRATDRR